MIPEPLRIPFFLGTVAFFLVWAIWHDLRERAQRKHQIALLDATIRANCPLPGTRRLIQMRTMKRPCAICNEPLDMSAGARVTFDSQRSTALPCFNCGASDTARTLVRVGVWERKVGNRGRAGDPIERPLCEACHRDGGL